MPQRVSSSQTTIIPYSASDVVHVLFFQIGTKVACPTAVALTATSAIALTAGSAAPAAIAGGAAGVTGCYIASTQCKRGVSIVAGHVFSEKVGRKTLRN